MLGEVVDINSMSELNELFDFSSGLIIDLRNYKSFGAGHLDNAVNVDLMSQHFMEFFTDIKKNRDILLYCDDGSRTRIAVRVLTEMGYSKLFSLHNGINSWDEIM